MPNWCSNYIRIYGDEGTIRTLTSIIKGLNPEEDRLFRSLIGIPSHMTEEQYEKDWYDTNIGWFGTKWDIHTEQHMFNFSKDEISFSCETAWSPPVPFLTNLCQMYHLNATLNYSEGGVGFAGQTDYEWINGELDVNDQEYGFMEGLYRTSNDEFWSEVEYRSDCIIDEEQSLEEFLEEFIPFVSDKDKEELTRIYNETIENNDDDEDAEGE